MFLEVYENVYVKVREGKASFWFDNWISSGPLAASSITVLQPGIKIKECWEPVTWDVDLLKELVGVTKTEEILMSSIKKKEGSDVFVWKPFIDGKFSTASAWEVIRVKGDEVSWMEWVWHKLLPRKISMCMWKAMF